MEGLGRSVALAIESLPPPIGVDLDSLVVPLVDDAPDLLALGVEGHDIAAEGAVATKKLPLAGEGQLAGQHSVGLLALLPRTGQRAHRGADHRSIVVGVELFAAGVQQPAVMVLQNREERAELVGVPNAEAVKRLDHDGIDLPGLDGTQEALEVGALVGLVPALMVLKPLVDLESQTLDRFTLAERVLFVSAATQVGNGKHQQSPQRSLPSIILHH